MSRTVRKDKFGSPYNDGKHLKEKHFCNCWHCTGYSGMDIKIQIKKDIVKDHLDCYYFGYLDGVEDDFDNESFYLDETSSIIMENNKLEYSSVG